MERPAFPAREPNAQVLPVASQAPPVNKLRLIVRPMIMADLDEVMAIERACFPTPWPRSAFVSELRSNPSSLYQVAEVAVTAGAKPFHTAKAQKEIVGYIGMWLIFDEAHITNLAVAPAWRRRGIAECLLSTLLKTAAKRGADKVYLEVRCSNMAAQALYRKYGFAESYIRKGYYRDNNEDALVMKLDGLSRPEVVGHIRRLSRSLVHHVVIAQ